MKEVKAKEGVARVTAEYKGAYKVKDSAGEHLAKITGKQMFDASSREDYPAVGDWVEIIMADKENAVIQKILPRKTIIKRKSNNKNETQIIATNIDVAFVVESVDRDFNLNRFERYFALANDGGVNVAIVLNKIDLISPAELDLIIAQIKNRFKFTDVILTSNVNNRGLDELRNYIQKDKTYCFLGSSGVGKSSLINQLLGKNILKTDEVSTYSDRGKHVTTKREMYFLDNGGIVIDNPGMREVGMADNATGIDDFFDDITDLANKCKYKDCTHTQETDCAVLVALKEGELTEGKYTNYLNLKKESEYFEMNKIEKREKDKRFGKFINKAKKSLGDFGHKDYGN